MSIVLTLIFSSRLETRLWMSRVFGKQESTQSRNICYNCHLCNWPNTIFEVIIRPLIGCPSALVGDVCVGGKTTLTACFRNMLDRITSLDYDAGKVSIFVHSTNYRNDDIITSWLAQNRYHYQNVKFIPSKTKVNIATGKKEALM